VPSASSLLYLSFQLPTATLAMATAEVQEIRATSYVGFDSITQQIEHKLLKRGFQFNVIVVGAYRVPLSPPKPASFCGKDVSYLMNYGFQVRPVWESRPSSTLFSLHTSSTRRAGVRLMSPSVRPQKFRRSLMVRSSLCCCSSTLLLCIFVTPLTRVPRRSYHRKRGATAP